MARTTGLRRQHDAAMLVVAEMAMRITLMGTVPTRTEAYKLTMLLAKLGGVLRIHLAQEDKVLYPRLMRSVDPEVADTARRFVAEMGQIGPAFAAYADTWRFADAIIAEPDRFRAETDVLFAALGDRIERENDVLYPMADRDAVDDPRAA